MAKFRRARVAEKDRSLLSIAGRPGCALGPTDWAGGRPATNLRKGEVMPYNSLSELPDGVKDNLPKGAQEIYKEAYNSAHEQYEDPDDRRGKASLEETAAKVAWAAVKKKYEKSDGKWRLKKE